MTRLLRVAIVPLFALGFALSLNAASAQMMHFTLNVVVETADGGAIPAGEVCVSGEVNPICQDIPADSPSGKEFSFPGLADGEHEVTVSAEPYLEAVDNPVLTENTTTITITLQKEDTAPPADELPDTGAGTTVETAGNQALMLVTGGLALGMLSLAVAWRRREGEAL
jgi:hypothetical protein